MDAPTVGASTSSDADHDEALLGQPYLLVFEGDSSHVHTLEEGELVIGRGKDVGLRLANNAVSRRHARLEIGEQVVVFDLGSQNGTRVNGERLEEPRALESGDIITIGPATLAFHAGTGTADSRCMIGFAELRRRLDEELDRALRHRRDFGVVGIELGEGVEPRAVERVLGEHHRQGELATWSGPSELLMLLADTGADGASLAASRIAQVIRPLAPEIRVGYAVCPLDGCDAATLLARARTAALAVEPGTIGAPPRNVRTIELGGRQVIIADKAMARLYGMIERIAAADLPVLITGETGTGKELAASAVHYRSPRANKPLVTLNCAALQVTLVESELFGHAKGAFSGAVAVKPGLLESASGGTVFLDEIGELSLEVQAKLLRALETKRVTRLGEVNEREVDVRLVAATNRDLKAEVAAGRFREDFYFRLSGATLSLPPLRERQTELSLLAEHFLAQACERAGREPMTISSAAQKLLADYPWPGNIRELKNVMDYVAAAFTDSVVKPHHVAERIGADPGTAEDAPEPELGPGDPAGDGAPVEFRNLADELRELEQRRIEQALEATGGNATQAAKLLEMPVRTFFYKVKKYGLNKGD